MSDHDSREDVSKVRKSDGAIVPSKRPNKGGQPPYHQLHRTIDARVERWIR
jgi:hypothetical protein